MSTRIPKTAQEVFTAVVEARAIPWLPVDDVDAAFLTWRQLVQENRVPADFAGIIHQLQKIADNPAALRQFAKRHNLDYPECTLSSTSSNSLTSSPETTESGTSPS